jgi:hypothetical protein
VAADYGLPLAAMLEAIEYCRSDPPEIAANRAREAAIMAAQKVQSEAQELFDAVNDNTNGVLQWIRNYW